MMEVTQDKVSYQTRFEEWHDKMMDLIPPTDLKYVEAKYPSSIAISLMKAVADMMELAYIAGANHVNISEGLKDIKDTGGTLVLARNFVKDKGFR